MNKEEINKIIAEFMGLRVHKNHIVTSVKYGRVNGSFVGTLYTESLDALVPVVEKIGFIDLRYSLNTIVEPSRCEWCAMIQGGEQFINESPPMALAKACAKVIQQL